jgi:7,8-dihydropterin-6-yl-methyl-4-(beta-D-ribofuranosyl)aminobenzene 5'-phosphate synthase
MMNVTCVVDNAARHGSQLLSEHGVAFVIETETGRALFDTGQSGTVLLHNMQALQIDPRQIDALAISHAHYDHTGGLPALLERARPGLPLYAHPDLFRERFSRRADGIESVGLSMTRQVLATKSVLHLSAAVQEILPGVWTSGEIASRPEPKGGSAHHLVREKNGWTCDPYLDDLSLVLEVSGGLALLCGCCHAGLLNTLAHVERTFHRPIVCIAGGVHLHNAEAHHVRAVCARLAGLGALQRVYLNHCSGKAAFDVLQHKLGPDIVRPCPAGTQLDLEDIS